MQDKWKKVWKKNYKKILTVGGSIFATLFLVLVIANAKNLQDAFDPDQYTSDNNFNNAENANSTTLFDAQQDKQNQGLELDQQSEDDYNMQEGEENLLNQNQNMQPILVADGTGQTGSDSDNNSLGGAAAVTTDGNGTPVIGGSGGNNPVPSATGTPGAGTPNGNGTDGDGKVTPTPAQPTATPTVTPVPTKTPDHDGDTDTPDPDADKYGTDYSNEHVTSAYPTTDEDQDKKVTVEKLTVDGSLKQHFYPGEYPRSEEMGNYISVTATMSDGSVRSNLKFIPFAGKGSGGDYSVDWSGTEFEDVEGVGKTKGDDYRAIITYRDKSVSVPYDIVQWQVTLHDFAEDFTQETNAVDELGIEHDAGEYEEILYPKDKPIIDLYNSMSAMYERIAARTLLNSAVGEPTHYRHINNITYPDGYTPVSLDFFGGWSEINNENAASTGVDYRIARPKSTEISQDNIYNVDLYPVWEDDEGNAEYQIALYGDITYGDWRTALLSYSGTSTTLTVPAGVSEVVYGDLSYYSTEEEKEHYKKIEKLILPSSVSKYEEGSYSWVYNLFPNLTSIEVATDNVNYLDIDGVLYDKTGKRLMRIPAGKKTVSKWSKTMNTIDSSALQLVHMKQLVLPESVTRINLDGFLNAHIDELVISCTTGLNLGMDCFANDESEVEATLGIKKIVLKSVDCSGTVIGGRQSALFGTTGESNLKDLGLQIVVPDSKNDQVYRNYLKFFQESIDYHGGIIGNAFGVLTTEDHAESRYLFQQGFLLSKDGKNLIQTYFNMNKDTSIPETVETIQTEAMDGCDSIATLSIPESVTKIDTKALAGMTKLTVVKMLAEDPAELGEQVFGEALSANLKIYVSPVAYDAYQKVQGPVLDRDYGAGTAKRVIVPMENLADVVFDDGNQYYQKEDGTYSLYKARNTLTGFFVPMDGTSEYMDGCFTDCTGLMGILLPDTLAYMGKEVFKNCTSLEVIASNAATAPGLEAETFASLSKNQIKLFIPGEHAGYDTWTGFSAVVDSGQVYLGESQENDNLAIYGVEGDDTILLCAILQTAGEFALRGDTTEIAPYVFAGSPVTAVTNASSLSVIGAHAFEGCEDLTEVALSSYLWAADWSFGEAAFKGCSNLTTLVPSFYNASWLTLPSGLTELPAECFAGCSSIQYVHFDTGITTMGEGCFQGCTGLESIIATNPEDYDLYYALPYNLTEVPASCFEGCSNLNMVSVQNKVTSIGARAFYGCTVLSTEGNYEGYFTLPESVTSIGSESFAGCSSLNIVEIYGALDSLGTNAFAWDGTLYYMYFEAMPETVDLTNVNEILDAYFIGCANLEYLEVGEKMILQPEEEQTEASELGETAEPAETAEPTETVEPTEEAGQTETAEPIETVEPTETVDPTEAVEPTETVEPTELVDPTEQSTDLQEETKIPEQQDER